MGNYVHLAAILLVLSGCRAPTYEDGKPRVHDIATEWRPLKQVVERPVILRDVGSPTATVCIGDTLYVRDLDQWLIDYYPGSAAYQALLAHEQWHAQRQEEMGLALWLARYASDRSFALYEEQVGYYRQLMKTFELNGHYVLGTIAASISSYFHPAGGRMITYDAAYNWETAMIQGNWKPAE